MDDAKIQWHPAFVCAMELTLKNDAVALQYEYDYSISKKPRQIDLIVIHHDQKQPLHDDLCALFRRYNLFEYKSPGDALNIDTFYKVIGYGCFYKALSGNVVNEIAYDEITLTMFRDEAPVKLLKDLAKMGIMIERYRPGIYHLHGNTLFPIQIVAGSELKGEQYLWLKSLTRRLDKKTAAKLLYDGSRMKEDSSDGHNYDAVIMAVTNANQKVFEELYKEGSMLESIINFYKPYIEADVRKELAAEAEKSVREAAAEGKAVGIAEGKAEGIAEGRAELSRNIAVKMLMDGTIPMDKIAKFSGFSMDELKEMKKKMVLHN